MAIATPPPELYTVQQVADHLGLHVRTVRSYVREGTLPAVRVGRQYRVARDDLDAFTARRPSSGLSPDAPPAPAVEVSTTVRVEPVDRRTADRLTTVLVGAAQGRSGDGGPPLHVSTAFEPERRLLRVVVVGGAGDTAALLRLVATVTEEGS